MPESTSLDALQDLEDFWSWVRSPAVADLLASQMNPVELDFDHVLTAGDSAGGLLSVSFALAHPDEVRACTAAYPNVDMDAEHYRTRTSEPPMGMSVSKSVIDGHIASMKDGDVLSSAFPPVRLDLMLGTLQHGTFQSLYDRGAEGTPRELRYPLEKLDQADARIPRSGIAIIHGFQDDIVPVDGSRKFVAKAREVMKGKPGGDRIVLSIQEGGHGFDGMIGLDVEWVQEAVRVAVETWLE